MEEQNYRRELPGSRRVILDIKDLPFSAREALNVLRGNIQLSGFDLKVIAVTSAMANEGKSTVAFRLAKSFSALKKRTLYLDCDIRNSSTMARYDIQEEVRGLSEFLCGEAVMNEIIYRTDDTYRVFPHTVCDGHHISYGKVDGNVVCLDAQIEHLLVSKRHRLGSRANKSGHTTRIS